jgi:hypothetical protein
MSAIRRISLAIFRRQCKMKVMEHGNVARRIFVAGAVLAAALVLAPRTGACFYHMEDSLRGSSTGNVSGGSFGADGWTVTGTMDRIWYILPTLGDGFIEFTSTDNLLVGDNEIFAMYEDAYGMGEPINYNPEFRNNHYKCILRIYGLEEPEPGRYTQKIIWRICPSGDPGHDDCGCTNFEEEPRSAVVSWDSSPQHFRIEWGGSVTRLLRNGEEQISIDWSATGYSFGPLEPHFSLGSPRSGAVPYCAMPIGITYADLVVEGNEAPVATCEGPAVDEEELLPEPGPDAPAEAVEETMEPALDPDPLEPLPEDSRVDQADLFTDMTSDPAGDDAVGEGTGQSMSGGCGCILAGE